MALIQHPVRLDGIHQSSSPMPALASSQPLATSGPVSIYIRLAEPTLFLPGSDQDAATTTTPTMLRGSLIVRIMKATKIRSVDLCFIGRARTEWPGGIPPKKVDDHEEIVVTQRTWPFFHAQWAESNNNADTVRLYREIPAQNSNLKDDDQISNVSSRKGRDSKRSSMQPKKSPLHIALPSTVLSGGEYDRTAQNTGYLMFQPGEYYYHFEHPVSTKMPESCRTASGSVKYKLEAAIERAGTWTANLKASREVELVRHPSEPSLEQVEPIAISRCWEDQLQYEVCISGKAFPQGTLIPIAIKLTPLAKIQIHRIRAVLSEHVEYFARQNRVSRSEPIKHLQLLEKNTAGPPSFAFPGSSLRILAGGGVSYDDRDAASQGATVPTSRDNILGDLEQEDNLGPTEMEFSVQLPGCSTDQRVNPSTNFKNININHWIKISLRISRFDATAPRQKRHFEISIDSPITILSCRATPQNLSLPAYDQVSDRPMQKACGCPKPSTTAVSTVSGTRPRSSEGRQPSSSAAATGALCNGVNLQIDRMPARPIHMLRQPSYAPPAWSEDRPPPMLMTPPPGYDQAVDGPGGLADYFSRLADEDDDDERLQAWQQGTGREGIPLTPGGRVHRSFDLLRQ